MEKQNKLRRLVWGVLPEQMTAKRGDYKFQFRDELAKRIMERRVKDLAAMLDITGSAVVEGVLDEALLPQGELARRYVNQVLLGESYARSMNRTRKKGAAQLEASPYGVREAAIDIFRANAMLAESGQLQEQLQPLVYLIYDIMPEHGVDFGEQQKDDGMREFLKKKLMNVKGCAVEAAKNGGLSDSEAKELARWLEEIDQFVLQLNSTTPGIYAFNYVEIILRIWYLSKSWQETYMFLAALLKNCQAWSDAPRDRTRFQNVCVEIFADWPSDAQADDAETIAIRPSSLAEAALDEVV